MGAKYKVNGQGRYDLAEAKVQAQVWFAQVGAVVAIEPAGPEPLEPGEALKVEAEVLGRLVDEPGINPERRKRYQELYLEVLRRQLAGERAAVVCPTCGDTPDYCPGR